MSRVNLPGTADWAAHQPIGDINVMRALFGVLLVGVTALVAGAIGYQAGRGTVDRAGLSRGIFN